MKQHILTFVYDHDFDIIAIATPMKGYRLCWFMNEAIGFDFVKQPDAVLQNSDKQTLSSHELFFYEDELNMLQYAVVRNRASGRLFLPELKHVDFLLKISGDIKTKDRDRLVAKLRDIPNLLTAFPVALDDLRNPDNLYLI